MKSVEKFLNTTNIDSKILTIEAALASHSEWNSLVDIHIGGVVTPMGEPSKDGASINGAFVKLKAEVGSIHMKLKKVWGHRGPH